MKTSPQPGFAAWLRFQRRQHDLTQGQLARAAGCAEITIRKLEAGTLQPSSTLTTALEAALGVSFAVDHPAGTPPSDSYEASTPEASVVLSVLNALARPGTRLISLTGSSAGLRTAAARSILSRAHARHAYDAVIADVPGIASQRELAHRLADALELDVSTVADPFEAVIAHLRTRQVLLILDGFDTLTADHAWVSRLLQAAPELRILLTLPERLHVYGEHEVRLPAEPGPLT